MAINKCVKQYSYRKNIIEIIEIAKRYQTAKNYFYSRYSGIKSISKINKHKSEIRDKFKSKEKCKEFGLQARQWKMALDEAVANIKSNWSNTKNRIKIAIANNENLSEEDRHFLFYILKADTIFESILCRKDFNSPKGLSEIKVDEGRKGYLFNLLRRYTRKYKNRIPYSKGIKSFEIDANMYNYIYEGADLYIEIMGLQPRKMIRFKLRDHYRYSGNLRIIIDTVAQSINIHRCIKIGEKTIEGRESYIIAMDKGYRKMLSCSNDKEYGHDFGKILTKRTNEINEKNKKRNKLWALAKKYEKEGNHEKARNIIKNNLGYVKLDRKTKKFKARTESYINYHIKEMIFDTKPVEIVKEDLTAVIAKKEGSSKSYNRKMFRWVKGILDKRLEYIASLYQIKITNVNAAYTSQVCHKCGKFGERNDDVFVCSSCGILDANINAAKNIEARRDDKEISIYTGYKKVKEILEERIPKYIIETSIDDYGQIKLEI